MLSKVFIVSAALLALASASCDRELMKPVEWSGGSFEWPCEATKKIYVSSGKYISKNIIATRGQIYKDDVILALPRYKPGVPATLAKVSLKQKGCEAVLQPFPCWTSQEEGNCQGLQSVVDLYLDAQEILWVLDVGVTNTLEAPVRRCPPKVLAISMKTGKLLKTLDLSGLVAQASRLQYVCVEYSADGRPFAYISDAATRSILVFDIAGNKGYRVILPKAIVAGMNRRDVLYIALTRKGCGNNFLVFTYLSSGRMFQIRTDYLRSGSTAGRVQDLGPKPSKLVVLGTDLGSAVFFRFEGKPEIYRWDTNTAFQKENFQVVYKSPNCLLATQAMPDLRRQRIRVLESNFPDFIQNTVGCGAVQQINLMSGSCN
ncbi:PREDICTED: major royal jelly protein 1 [Nicrophorus vespilloides]|uniref:Major royal jelly protein 1 n=1 Tax=Nicrophorus vespilloides TaxID=110193 RepID=A0ABM1MW19_NICVS|nr:PREDICTED: major royal jelly protein 1 [Nicrophorus vespilloides]